MLVETATAWQEHPLPVSKHLATTNRYVSIAVRTLTGEARNWRMASLWLDTAVLLASPARAPLMVGLLGGSSAALLLPGACSRSKPDCCEGVEVGLARGGAAKRSTYAGPVGPPRNK